MALLQTGYDHWNGQVQNIWKRRAVVARQTMKTCLRGRVVRFLVIVPWVIALATATVYFAIGQVLVPSGLLEPLNFYLLDGRGRAIMDGLVAWLALYPDITVRAAANLLLLNLSGQAQTISFLIITLILPRLLTRDIASNAIVIYSSRAISRFDYLFGKLAGLLGVLALSWLGPVLAAWVLGNLVAPDWAFFWHSRAALLHSLLILVPSLVATALLALAISALSSKSRTVLGIWLAVWLLAAALPLASHSRPWLAYVSFSHSLKQLAVAIFNPYQDFVRARDSLPFFNSVFGRLKESTVQQYGDVPVLEPSIALVVVMALAILILLRRIRAL